jgi:hypothetical protein
MGERIDSVRRHVNADDRVQWPTVNYSSVVMSKRIVVP